MKIKLEEWDKWIGQMQQNIIKKRKDKMKIEKAKFGRFIIKDCVNCKTRLDYQITNLEIDGIRNYLCDDCLEELVFKINEHLDLNKI